MEFVTYSLQAFSADLAKRGHLCVVTSYGFDIKETSTISSDSVDFKKAGIPTFVNSNEFTMLIGDVTALFDNQGYPKDLGSKDYQMFLGSIIKDPKNQLQLYGNAIRRVKKVTTTKTAEGVVTNVEEYKPIKGDDEAEKNVLVSSLNARDNFAVQALKCIMPMISDLKNMGDDERDFYCKLAYQWAASMMDNAAQARATFVDKTYSTEQSTDITELETNQEKLLNNILFTMERAQQITPDEENQIVSDRIVNPELNSRIDKLEATIKAHTTAFNTAMLSLTTALNNQNTILGQIKTAIENLELSPVINNNIVVPEPVNNTEKE